MPEEDDSARASEPDEPEISPGPAAGSPWRQQGEEPDYRATMANERTLPAWSRTALAPLAASFSVVKLTDATPRPLRLALGAYLIALASGVAIAGYVQWRTRPSRMRRRQALGRNVIPAALTAGRLMLAGFVVAVIALAS
ncbi:YidH family protein [Streptomyces sp. NPDC088910]|uniref:YidH family protein n=1 Tax=Streptomyces sp. NPDC088910 TaxID=3365911 RepID=UPI0038094684